MAQAADGCGLPDNNDQWIAIGTPGRTPLSTASTMPMVPPDMHVVPPAALPFPAPLESQHVVADDAQPKHLPPVETLSNDQWDKFLQVLVDHGLDPDAGQKVVCGQLKLGYKPEQVSLDMEQRWESCPYLQWNWDAVPIGKNPQMCLVVQHMMEMFRSSGHVNGQVLWAVLCNAKLLTAWYQHLRSSQARGEFMAYEHPGQKFNYQMHNDGFKQYCKERTPQCLRKFP